jgi:hypothetical protein
VDHGVLEDEVGLRGACVAARGQETRGQGEASGCTAGHRDLLGVGRQYILAA